ncbi:MAG: signal peptide peptidase SppA [Candidatus Adiutrix sp.]|jgi:protease-4|nr:signal peptide peptidase SppA [Candidatus Adiutrix sp.]
MRHEDWQAWQAGRTVEDDHQKTAATPVSANPGQKKGRPVRGGMGWPMATLLFGLAVIGACAYILTYVIDSLGSVGSLTRAPGVGVLVIEDEITGSIWATDILRGFNEDSNIRAVVIRVNSPGGGVAPCQEIYKAVKNMKKPVVVSMGSIAASGGLYIAAAGDLIMANPGTITGSIGVIMQSVEVSGTMEKIGLKSQVIKSGEYKDIGSPFRAMRENERALLQKMVNEVYEQFLGDLSAGRPKLGEAAVRALADGRIYSGAEAVKLGLVDEVGGFEDAVARAAKMGGLEAGKRPELTIDDGRKPWWQTFIASKTNIGLALPPALTPGFSLKYIYQPDFGSNVY